MNTPIFKQPWLYLIGVIWLLTACQPAPEMVTISGPTMGTTYTVKFSSVEQVDRIELQRQIDTILVKVNALMSTYDPNSELSQFNLADHAVEFPLSPETLLVMRESMRLGALSGGALDITIGPLVNMWGFGPTAKPEQVPTEAEIASAKQRVGLDKLQLTDKGAIKLAPSMYVDLSTVAKGYGVDQVAEVLMAAGIEDYLVEVGGEMRVAGLRFNGEGWRIAVEKPVTHERAVQQLINVGNNAVATAGDYRNYYEENGQRFSHLIDPTTGYPINHNLVSVTVVHPSSLTADGLATAINIMGKERGLQMALQENLAVLLITKENGEFKQYNTPEFESFLVKKPL